MIAEGAAHAREAEVAADAHEKAKAAYGEQMRGYAAAVVDLAQQADHAAGILMMYLWMLQIHWTGTLAKHRQRPRDIASFDNTWPLRDGNELRRVVRRSITEVVPQAHALVTRPAWAKLP